MAASAVTPACGNAEQQSVSDAADNAIQGDPLPGFRGIWHEDQPDVKGKTYSNKYGGGLAVYPQQVTPHAVYHEGSNRTYFTFSAGDDQNTIRHALSFFDHETGELARPVAWTDIDTHDAHDSPALLIDDYGYIFLFANTHGEERRSYIRRSAKPHDLSAYVDLLSSESLEDLAVFAHTDPDARPGVRFSYASPWLVRSDGESNTIALPHTRYVDSQRYSFLTTSPDGDVWTAPSNTIRMIAGSYMVNWGLPDGKGFGTAFNVHPHGIADRPLNARTNLYFVKTTDLRAFETASGEVVVDLDDPFRSTLTDPVNPALVYDAPTGTRVYIKDLAFDADGDPHILFVTSPTLRPGPLEPGERRSLFLASYDDEWSFEYIEDVLHNYDHGSIIFDEGADYPSIVGTFLPGPQLHGTGGEVGRWDRGADGRWSVSKTLTSNSAFNHVYVRRPFNAHEGFQTIWASGHAFKLSEVGLYFSDASDQVYKMPYTMPRGVARIEPEPMVEEKAETSQ